MSRNVLGISRLFFSRMYKVMRLLIHLECNSIEIAVEIKIRFSSIEIKIEIESKNFY